MQIKAVEKDDLISLGRAACPGGPRHRTARHDRPPPEKVDLTDSPRRGFPQIGFRVHSPLFEVNAPLSQSAMHFTRDDESDVMMMYPLHLEPLTLKPYTLNPEPWSLYPKP